MALPTLLKSYWSIIHLLLFPISLGIFNGISRIFNWPCGVLLLAMRLATLFIATPVGEPVDIHEIQPVKIGGSPIDTANKIILDRRLYRQQVTPWWNSLQKTLERK